MHTYLREVHVMVNQIPKILLWVPTLLFQSSMHPLFVSSSHKRTSHCKWLNTSAACNGIVLMLKDAFLRHCGMEMKKAEMRERCKFLRRMTLNYRGLCYSLFACLFYFDSKLFQFHERRQRQGRPNRLYTYIFKLTYSIFDTTNDSTISFQV